MKSTPPTRQFDDRRTRNEPAVRQPINRRPANPRLIAANVISRADRAHPADAVLRAELKSATGISREQGREISRAVFAYYRWLGWLDRTAPVGGQIDRAVELDRAFQANPGSLSDAELRAVVPEWIFERMDASAAWLRALQTEPHIWLRARSGQGNGLGARLTPSTPAGLPDALRYQGSEDLFRTPEFHDGEFELQDLSSQAVGWICAPEPGQTWWDACAGEGGKTLHLAELMRGKGLVWASDRATWRLQLLKRRTARAKVFNYRSVLWDGGAKLPTKTKFDGILVDAPCSGIGTWQRNPHARWTTTPEDIAELGEVQKRLLTTVVPALKPGGKLFYSVCTLAQAETTAVQAEITGRFPELVPLSLVNPLDPSAPTSDSIWLWPQTVAANGMFVCGWQKTK